MNLEKALLLSSLYVSGNAVRESLTACHSERSEKSPDDKDCRVALWAPRNDNNLRSSSGNPFSRNPQSINKLPDTYNSTAPFARPMSN